MMIKLMKKVLFAFIFSLSALTAHALDSELLNDIKPGIVSMQMQDPERNVGYTVGDVLTRHLIISIKKPYKLIDESLPWPGLGGDRRRATNRPLAALRSCGH